MRLWVILVYSGVFLSACQSQTGEQQRLLHTWACDGYGATVAAETYFGDGRYVRYEKKPVSKSGGTRLYEGGYILKDKVLTTWLRELAPGTRKGRNISLKLENRYRIVHAGKGVLELEVQSKKAQKGLVRTCRRIDESKPGQVWSALYRKRYGRVAGRPVVKTTVSPVQPQKPRASQDSIRNSIDNKSKSPVNEKSTTKKITTGKIITGDAASGKTPIATTTRGETAGEKSPVKKSPIATTTRGETAGEKSPVTKTPGTKTPDTKNPGTKNTDTKTPGIKVPGIKATTGTKSAGPSPNRPAITAGKPGAINADSNNVASNKTTAGNQESLATKAVTGPMPTVTASENTSEKSSEKTTEKKSAAVAVTEKALPAQPDTQSTASDHKEPDADQKQLSALVQKKGKLLTDVRELDSLFRQNLSNYEIFRALSGSLQRGIRLTSISKQGEVYTINGESASTSVIRRFMKNLKKSSFLRGVRMTRIRLKRRQRRFRIRFLQRSIGRDYSFVRLSRIRKTVSLIESHQHQVKDLQILQKALLASLPDQRATSAFIRDIKSLGKRNGVRFSQFKAEKEEEQAGYTRYMVRVNARASFRQYLTFLNTLARMRYATEVSQLQVTPASRFRKSRLHIDMLLVIYKSPAGVQSKRNPAGPRSTEWVQFTPYKIIRPAQGKKYSNPFRLLASRNRVTCTGPLGRQDISNLRLVRIMNKYNRIAIFRSPNGYIYRARKGSCIARNIRVSIIARRAVKLRKITSRPGGRLHVQIRRLRLSSR